MWFKTQLLFSLEPKAEAEKSLGVDTKYKKSAEVKSVSNTGDDTGEAWTQED